MPPSRSAYVTAREHLLATKRRGGAAPAARAPPPAFLAGMAPLPPGHAHAPPHAARTRPGRQPSAAALQATLHLLLSPLTSAGASACAEPAHAGLLSDFVVQ
jgi:hypothetical protein